MYPVEGHSITQMYKSFQANTSKDVRENPFLALLDKLLRCALYYDNNRNNRKKKKKLDTTIVLPEPRKKNKL